MSDYISRQAAIDRINKQREHLKPDIYPQDKIGDAAYRICAEFIERLPSAQPEQRWIPVKTRPMTEEERQYWEEHTGVELEDEDAVFFDCQMPDDGQEIWVCYKSGAVSEDVCERDDFCELEGNGDWLDIVAWMPRIKPEPWKGEDDEVLESDTTGTI